MSKKTNQTTVFTTDPNEDLRIPERGIACAYSMAVALRSRPLYRRAARMLTPRVHPRPTTREPWEIRALGYAAYQTFFVPECHGLKKVTVVQLYRNPVLRLNAPARPIQTGDTLMWEELARLESSGYASIEVYQQCDGQITYPNRSFGQQCEILRHQSVKATSFRECFIMPDGLPWLL